MENITLGTIAACLAFICTLIGSVEYLHIRISRRLGQEVGKIVNNEIKDLRNEIKEVKQDIIKVKDEANINERDRIRYEILQFSGSLRNGLSRTEHDYKHIEEIFEKYERKGWNSYIHSEMEFIRECRNKIDK